jgi:2-methylcitrate dehydratase PrpD
MTHGQIEMAADMRKEYETHGIPEKISISLPKSCFPVVGTPASNKINPQCIVDAQFSSYFQTAAVWLYGDQLGWDIYEEIYDQAVQDLCARINCQIEDSYVALESKLTVIFKDGLVVENEIVFPIGEKERPFEWDTGVRRKFIGLAEPVYGKERSEEVCKLVGSLETTEVASLMILVK